MRKHFNSSHLAEETYLQSGSHSNLAVGRLSPTTSNISSNNRLNSNNGNLRDYNDNNNRLLNTSRYNLASSRQQLMSDEMSQELTYLSREAPLDGGESTLAAPSYSQLGIAANADELHYGQHAAADESLLNVTALDERSLSQLKADNVDIKKAPLKHAGFLVSFMVDARGGAMRGCRHSGVRVIIPTGCAPQPMRITCRYLRRERLVHPPPLMEGEACASRIMEVGPAGARFLGPVLIEVPHFASLSGDHAREIIILRSDNGQVWREHVPEFAGSDDHSSNEEQKRLIESIIRVADENEAAAAAANNNNHSNGDENADPNKHHHGGVDSADESILSSLSNDQKERRLTRIVTHEFPQYFAIISRVRQECHTVGPDGLTVSSESVSKVQAIFTEAALTKRIKIGLQALPVPDELLIRTFGSLNLITFSPVVTIEPRRRKFHCPIRLKIPLPPSFENKSAKDDLRLLCSISGGSNRAVWEDVTGNTPTSIVNQCLVFTTTISARFWLGHCQRWDQVGGLTEMCRYADDIWRQLIRVPFMAKFVIFAKRSDGNEANLRIFCMTDDKEDERALEQQEHYEQMAKSRDVEVFESQKLWLEFGGNLSPYRLGGSMRQVNGYNSQTSLRHQQQQNQHANWASTPQPLYDQLSFLFRPFEENRLAFVVRLKDVGREPMGRIAFMRESIRWLSSLAPNQRDYLLNDPNRPVCTLGLRLPPICVQYDDILGTPRRNSYLANTRLGKMSLAEIAAAIDAGSQQQLFSDQDRDSLQGATFAEPKPDWARLAPKLGVPRDEMDLIASQWPRMGGMQSDSPTLGLLLHWHRLVSNLEPEVIEQDLARALISIRRRDIADHLGIILEPTNKNNSRNTRLSSLGEDNYYKDNERQLSARNSRAASISSNSNRLLTSQENLYANAAMLNKEAARAKRVEEAEAEVEAERRQRRRSSTRSRSSQQGDSAGKFL